MHTITRTSPPTHLHSHKSTMAAGRCPKWSTSLKEDFRLHIEAKRINPKRTDKEYILQIRDRYYPGRPDDTFLKNYNASVSEWRIGHYVNAYNNRHKDREFCFLWLVCFNICSHDYSHRSGGGRRRRREFRRRRVQRRRRVPWFC